MAIVLRRTERIEIPEGRYPATITSVTLEENVPVPWGKADRLQVVLTLDNGAGRLVQRYIAHLSETSELGRFLRGLLDELPDEFDVASLVGTRCLIRVEHRESRKGTPWVHVAEAEPLDEGFEADCDESDVAALFEDET